jgi:class 3 adenylate cyclase
MKKIREFKGAFLISDLAGYTPLTETHGDLSASEIVERYLSMVKNSLEPDTEFVERVGDEVLILSENVINLIKSAIKLVENIYLEHNFPTIHAGIHGGTIIERNGHYLGSTLNLTSRIASYSKGGQLLCSGYIRDIVGCLSDICFIKLEKIRFKNYSDPVEIFEIITPKQKESITIDPVCRMQVNKDDPTARLPFGDITYYFCSYDCAKLFIENPQKFVH